MTLKGCRRGHGVALILGITVPGKLRFPRVLRQPRLLKPLIDVISYAHFRERLCFTAKVPLDKAVAE